jgi:flavin-dependent dehydrogenase
MIWDEEADVVVLGYGFAGATAAITAHDAGAKVLLLEKAPERYKGGNSRVSANLVFWPNDIEKAKVHFKALAGPFLDNISEEMIHVGGGNVRQQGVAGKPRHEASRSSSH